MARMEEAEAALLTELEEKAALSGINLRTFARRLRQQVRGQPLRPKYQSPTGETWSGRGIVPTWLKNEEAQGRTRDQFLIQEADEAL